MAAAHGSDAPIPAKAPEQPAYKAPPAPVLLQQQRDREMAELQARLEVLSIAKKKRDALGTEAPVTEQPAAAAAARR